MKNATDFLIDISGKMDKKMSIVQNVLMDGIIPNMEFSEPFGMRTFLSVVKSPIIINSLDMGKNLREEFVKKIQNLPFPNGGAPIAEAFKESVAGFKKYEAAKGAVTRRIVYVTNGDDTDSGVLDYEVEKVIKDYPIQVNIIGICMSESDQNSAKKVTEMTGGAFCNVEESTDLATLRTILSPVIDALHNVKPVKVEAPVVKEEPVVAQVKEEVPAQAKVVEVKVEAPAIKIEKVETPVVDEEKEKARQSQIAEIAKSKSARGENKIDLNAMAESNAMIMSVLEQNKNMVAQLLEDKKADANAMDMLMVTIKENESTIQELREVNGKLSNQNQDLQALVEEQKMNFESLTADFKSLTEEKLALQKEIDRLHEIANEMLK